MTLTRLGHFAGAALVAVGIFGAAAVAQAQQALPDKIKIAFTTDMSGPNSAPNGIHSVRAAEMAIEDFGGKVLDRPIELIYADNQNKPDVALSIAREWLDKDGVNAIMTGALSSIALALQDITSERNVPHLLAGPGHVDLTGAKCTPMSIQFAWDTYAFSKSLVQSVVKAGNDTWFIIAMDYATGHALEASVTSFVEAAGGKIVGSVRHPPNTSDFASYLLQAQASGAKVVIPATVGADLVNLIKQADQFQLTQNGQKLVLGASNITDINGIGLDIAGDIEFVQPFYHDRNEETRAWADRLRARDNDNLPGFQQAAVYSAVTHYLKGVQAAGTVDGKAVVAKMKEIPINDFDMKDVKIRADGTAMRPMYLIRVKNPEESKYKYDYFEILDTIDATTAFRPEADTGCKLAAQ